jgi:hypothetical protein
MYEQTRYPHLLDQDAPILTAYLKQNGARYTQVDFDVRIGLGRDPGPYFEINIRKMALDLSRRRIDALGQTPRGVEIIEVTGAAGTNTLGQLTAYATIYQSDHPTEPPPRLILAAASLQTDMQTAYTNAGIEIHLYPDAER